MVVAGVWVTPSGTRRKYVPVGSEPASLLATVPECITHTPVLSSSILAANTTTFDVVAEASTTLKRGCGQLPLRPPKTRLQGCRR
jgi:hypothetical protein